MTDHSPNPLVCFAVPSESLYLRKSRPDLKILHTGMGHVNANKTLITYLETNKPPSMIISAGFAGGLNPAIKTGEVLIEGAQNQSLSPRFNSCDASKGTFLCVERIADKAMEKGHLRRESNKDAVEMESGVIHKIAHRNHIPCVTIRVISDAANEDLPIDFNRLMTADMKIHFPKLLWTLALQPSTIPKLIRFNKNVQRSARNLAQTISKALPK
jgi:adenosylhomocysteine nucleosidase